MAHMANEEKKCCYYLATYATQENFLVSKKFCLFGARPNAVKIGRLRRGDLIIIRDSRSAETFAAFGYCRVVGPVFNQVKDSPFKQLLWPDEQAQGRVLYPWRVAVEFEDVPVLNLKALTWSSIADALRLAKGDEATKLRRAVGPSFNGNYIRTENRVAALRKLIGPN